MSRDTIDKVVDELCALRDRRGRLFLLGVGGSAANCGHAVNDFRKLCGIEAYAPTDNVSELTARINDEGWSTSFSNWLAISNFCKNDALFVLSVGGGDKEQNVSPNIVEAIDLAYKQGASILGIVGPRGGHTAKSSDLVVKVPSPNPNHITPHTEAFQSVIWHLMVGHPKLKKVQTKWESIEKGQ